MSITEAILEKVNALPPEKQAQVLEFVETIIRQGAPATKGGKPYAFLETAMRLKLQGPPDWSENLDDYLYGDKKDAL